jgi:ankyrin repeat protein
MKFDQTLSERTTKDGSTALHLAVMASAPLPVIKHLIDSVPDEDDVWATNGTGSTPLHLACMEGNIPVMKTLLAVKGADVNLPDGQGQSCLHISIILGHFLMSKALLALEHPFKPAMEQTGNQNNTALHYACSNHQYNLVKLLLEHGANVHAKNKMKMTPSELGNDDEIIDLLFANRAKYMPKKISKKPSAPKKSAAPKKGKGKVVDSEEEEEDDDEEEEDDDDDEDEEEEEEEDEEDEEEDEEEEEEEEDSDEEEDEDEDKVKSDEELFESVKVGCIPYLESIIGSHDDLKRNVNKIRDSESKATLLHAAAKYGHLDVAQYLVEGAGASVDLKDEYGMTPLHYAVEAQQLLLVRYLVKYCGAKLDVKDNAGNVAIDLADEDEADDDENLEEICRIIQNSLKKPPSKRKLVKTPVIKKSLL